MEPDDEVLAIEIRLLLEAIHARYGYDLREYSLASMGRRVMAALAKSGLEDLGQFQHRLLENRDFFANVFEDLTVRVSEMFRNPSFYQSLRAQVVPILRTYPLLKIWHAGCASGEEVYASAILLDESGLLDRSQLYATDLSTPALEQARQGIFAAEHLPTFTENYDRSGGSRRLGDYYTEAYGRIAMKEALRQKILFFQHNLVSDHVFGEMHLIFCRNVLIYFGQDLRERVIGKLAQSLCPGGFLCLGSSERLGRMSQETALREFCAEQRIYRHER